jgi:hypothetical protein
MEDRRFYIFRRLETGELVCIACRETLNQAKRLLAELRALWPADYRIQKEAHTDKRPAA